MFMIYPIGIFAIVGMTSIFISFFEKDNDICIYDEPQESNDVIIIDEDYEEQ